jgi:hypothetical protein
MTIGDNTAIYSSALAEATTTGDKWLEESNVPVLRFLLDHGASETLIDSLMIRAVKAPTEPSVSEELMDLLLVHGGSVNHDQGLAVQLAASREDVVCFENY